MTGLIGLHTAGKKPLVVATTFDMFASLQPTGEGQLTRPNWIKVGAVGGHSQNSVQNVFEIKKILKFIEFYLEFASILLASKFPIKNMSKNANNSMLLV